MYTLTKEQLLEFVRAGWETSAEGFNGEYSSSRVNVEQALKETLEEELERQNLK